MITRPKPTIRSATQAPAPLADAAIVASIDNNGYRPGIAPEGTRIYVIGDVHGQYPLLLHLHELIVDDAQACRCPRKLIVYLGDMVDRGRRAREVIELLSRRPLAGFQSVFLRGNHEDMMLAGFYDDCRAPGWLYNGGESTLFSYDIRGRDGLHPGQTIPDTMSELRHALPEQHLAFLKALKPYHREGGYVFAHAGVRPGVPLAEQVLEDLVWIRDGFIDCTERLPYVVVHGHTPVEEPEVRDYRIGIDTGACSTGTLTCLVLEGDERRFLSVHGRTV